MKALWFEAPGRVVVREEGLVVPAAGEVLVRGLASAVSQGTELLLVRGEGPTPFDPSMGATTYPLRYGYAWVGALEDGTRVFGLLPHGDAHAVSPSALRVLPADVPAPRATLAANLETAITCAWDSEVAFGERVTVFGGGVVGLLVAWILRRSADVRVIEPRPRRAAIATALGATADHAEADVVIEATGDPRVLDQAIACAAPGGRVIVASFYGARSAPVSLGDAFHRRRLGLTASQVSVIPPRLTPRWSHARRFELVRTLLRDPVLDTLIAPPVPFDDAPALYARLAARTDDDDPPCHVFEYA